MPCPELYIPENVLDFGLSPSAIASLVNELKRMPANSDGTHTIGEIIQDMDIFMPYQGEWGRHPDSAVEPQFLLDRELLAMLWEAFICVHFLHINDFAFDRTHFFLMDLLVDLFRCRDPRLPEPLEFCHVHQEVDLDVSDDYHSTNSEDENSSIDEDNEV